MSRNEWYALAIKAIRSVAADMPDFTTDSVWARLSYPPKEVGDRKLISTALDRACNAGVCMKTDKYVNSGRRVNHSNPKRIYKSLVFQEK